jgi:hypothetical protein
MDVAWTEYLKYRAAIRGFDLDTIEKIAKSSQERYTDTATNRHVVVGRCGKTLVVIPWISPAWSTSSRKIFSTW